MKSVLIFAVLCLWTSARSAGIQEEFTWTRISYVWPRDTQSRFGYYGNGKPTTEKTTLLFPDGQIPTENVPENVNYIYENNVPMGANIWKNKLFVTVPRRRYGVPSSLNYVDMDQPERHNVPLIPYPNWEVNALEMNEEERIVSVYRVAVDPCDRLWVLDTGVMEIPGNRTRLQPPTLLVIDLHTDQIIRRYALSESVLTRSTTLALVTVDVTADTCDDAFVYLPDFAGYGLVVYSYKENTAWRVSHNYFFLEPLRGEFFIGGFNFQWNDGIFSVALSEVQKDGFRTAYFHSMAGTNMYSVSTRILKNRSLATRSYHQDDFKFLGDRGPGAQTSASDLHKSSGVLFLALVNQNALGCWNTRKPFKRENFAVVQKDNEKMIYPCDLKVAGNKVVLLTNTMPVFLYGNLDYNQVNFRVWISPVKDAVKGTTCA